MKIHAFSSSFLLLAGLVLAAAPGRAGDAGDKFTRLDADGDGRVTAAEHDQYCETEFKQQDVNRDGVLSPTELGALPGYDRDANKTGATGRLNRIDTTGDGKVSRTENAEYARLMFKRADGDGDDALTRAEFENAHRAMKTGKTNLEE